MNLKKTTYYFSGAAILIFASLFVAYGGGKKTKNISMSNEKEFKVSMDAGLGDVYISRGSQGKVLDATVSSDRNIDLNDCIEYDVRDRVGFLNFSTDCDEERKHTKKSSVHIDWKSSDWWLKFTDEAPISFDLELGMGKADLDMTGLSVKDLNLSAGASSVTLRFDEPNKSVIEDMNIEAGLSKFDATGLSNANFNHFKFEGGVGGYSLDFSGKLKKEVDVDIKIGLGSITIIIPQNVGVKIYCEKNWFSHLSIDSEFDEKEDDTYYSSNYYSSSGRMNMHVEAGLGTVKIRRE